MINVLRYYPRFLADYLVTRGAAMLVVGLVLLLPVLFGATEMQGAEGFDARSVLTDALRNTGPLLILVAAYGIIGHDIRQGFYRFLFAKPVVPIAYYAAAFVTALIGFELILVILTVLFALIVTPVWPGLMFLDAAIYFFFLGSLIFALSRFTRLDWLFGIFLLSLGNLARDVYPKDESWLGAVLNVVLPPDAPPRYFDTANVPWPEFWWVVGYAALAFAIGLLSIRFVPMGSAR